MAPESEPFVGPRPYTEADRDIFFGRDAEIAEVVSLVIAHRSVLLYAMSGAGKSSLVRAGLIRTLEDEGFEVLGPLRFQSPASPSRDVPNVYAYAALRALDANGKPIEPATSLADALAGLPRGTDTYGFPTPRVVIFDQFEELFTTHQERWTHREAFLRQAADALARDTELRLLFSIREEYIAQLERYAALLPDGLRARAHLERLRAPAALAAVTGPLALRGIAFKPGVAETLVHDLRETRVDMRDGTTRSVDGEFVEPVQLQVVCRTLWGRLDPSVREVSADDLAALGDVDESLGEYYDAAIAAALARAPTAEHKFRDALERSLITSAGTRATVFAGERETADLPADALDELARRHVIRAEWRAGGQWLELSHDRLIEPVRRSNQRVRERQRKRRLITVAFGVSVVAALAVVALLFAASHWFSKATVPNVVGSASTFDAESKITAAGLTLANHVAQRRTNDARPGTVIAQTPAAGDKVDKGSAVALAVAVATAKVTTPGLIGQTLRHAATTAQAAGLSLGQASPASARSPKSIVASQIPVAGTVVGAGTAIDVFLTSPPPVPTTGGGGGGGGGGITTPSGRGTPAPTGGG